MNTLSGLLVVCASVILLGRRLHGRTVGRPRTILAAASAVLFLTLLVTACIPWFSSPALATGEAVAAPGASGMGFIAAGISTGLACIAAGIAVGMVGAAALGLVGEKPEMLGTTLIYLGLAEGIAIYGIIVSLLILGKV